MQQLLPLKETMQQYKSANASIHLSPIHVVGVEHVEIARGKGFYYIFRPRFLNMEHPKKVYLKFCCLILIFFLAGTKVAFGATLAWLRGIGLQLLAVTRRSLAVANCGLSMPVTAITTLRIEKYCDDLFD